MRVFNIFSKRKRKKKLAGKVDVYTYDNIPVPFRNQVIHIWDDALGPFHEYSAYEIHEVNQNNSAWTLIHKALTRELGVFSIGDRHGNPQEQCVKFIQTAETDNVLDIIELTFRVISQQSDLNEYQRGRRGISQESASAIAELNHRFFEHGLGYQYQNGEIIRIDSQLVHEEVVKTGLTLIHEEGFIGAEDEFRKAYEHYRHQRYKEALNDALKAFESTAKSICEERRWNFPPNATAKTLIDLIFQNNLVATELQSHFSALRSVLESGVPTVRNKQGGHGQGSTIKDVPPHLVGFILHSTASAIVFMVQAHKDK